MHNMVFKKYNSFFIKKWLINYLINYLSLHNFDFLIKNGLFNFSLFMNKQQLYFKYYIKDKYFILSNGQLLKFRIKDLNEYFVFRSFKKSVKSINASVSTIRRSLNKKLENIYIFNVSNYNFATNLWLEAFFTHKYNISYFLISKSWNYLFKRRRRIKRKIWKNLKRVVAYTDSLY